jgi:transaldolase
MSLDNDTTPADIWIRRDPTAAAIQCRPDQLPGDRSPVESNEQTGDAQPNPAADRDTVGARGPTRLQRLYVEHGQSPWLDGLSRGHLADGSLSRLVVDGIRGVTANPTTFAKAIVDSLEYDEQLAWLTLTGCSVEEAYGELLAIDTVAACGVLLPVYRTSHGLDGFVSVEVAPGLADDTHRTIAAARALHQRIDQVNLLVKVPATAEGVPAVKALVAGGRNVNATLLFSLSRYAEVIEAYLSGLETFISHGGDPSRVHSVASFFVGRVDAEIDQRLEARGGGYARVLGGRAGVAQAKLAYQLFNERFSGKRWERLASHGAHPQLPLWASTAPKNPAYRDTRYVEELLGPQTVSTLPERTLHAFEDHGTVARTIDIGVQDARDVMRWLADAGIDLEDVGLTLEHQGVAGFRRSFQEAIDVLDAKRQRLGCA